MKKSLLALAVVAALPGVALAQSSVTISGNIKTGLSRFSTDSAVAGLGKIKDTAMSDGSSRIILSGTEDLGGGMAAVFQVDNRFNGNDGTSGNGFAIAPQGLLAGGNTFVGLQGAFGKLHLGNLDTHYGQGTDEFASRGTSLGASSTSLLDFVGNGLTPIANTSRSKNVIRYVTPVVSGFSAQLDYSAAYAALEGGTGYQTRVANTVTGDLGTSTASPGKGQATHFQLNFAEGPAAAGVSFWDAKVENVAGLVTGTNGTGNSAGAISLSYPSYLAKLGTKSGEKSTKIFGSYDLGVVKVGATFDDSRIRREDAKGDLARKATSFSLTAPVGPGAVVFQYTKANAIGAANDAASNADTGATQISLGYDYVLSKRTSFGVNYSKINNQRQGAYNFFTGVALQNAPLTAAGTDTSMLYGGFLHKF